MKTKSLFFHTIKKIKHKKLILTALTSSLIIVPILATTLTSCSINNNFSGDVQFPNNGSQDTIENTKAVKYNDYKNLKENIQKQYETLSKFYNTNFVGNEEVSQYNFPDWNNYWPKNNLLLIEECRKKFDLWINENDAGILFTAYYNIINLMHALIGFEWLMLGYISLALYDYISHVQTENNNNFMNGGENHQNPTPPIPTANINYMQLLWKTNLNFGSVDQYRFANSLYLCINDFTNQELLTADNQYFETFQQYCEILKAAVDLNCYMMNHKLPSSFYENCEIDGEETFWDFFANPKDETSDGEYEQYKDEMTRGYNFVLEICRFMNTLFVEPSPPAKTN